MPRNAPQLENLLERALWRSRFVVIVAVVASLLLSFGVFFSTTVDVVYTVGTSFLYANPSIGPEGRALLRREVLATTVSVIDGYLFASILLVFSLGLYELFIKRLDPSLDAENAKTILSIQTIDDLKDRLAKVVQLILVIEFFKLVLLTELTSSTDLLYLAASILLISIGIYLMQKRK